MLNVALGVRETVPIPPQLVSLLRWHLRAHGTAPDGRLFRGARGGPLSESLYGRIWHQARAAASISAQHAIHPVLRPYDLRHAALSLWLASGAPPAEIAARAGHSVNVLLAVYAHCLPGHDQIASRRIGQALGAGPRPAAGPPKCRDTGLFNLATRKPVEQLPHPSPVTAVAYRNNGSLVTVATDGTNGSFPSGMSRARSSPGQQITYSPSATTLPDANSGSAPAPRTIR